MEPPSLSALKEENSEVKETTNESNSDNLVEKTEITEGNFYFFLLL